MEDDDGDEEVNCFEDYTLIRSRDEILDQHRRDGNLTDLKLIAKDDLTVHGHQFILNVVPYLNCLIKKERVKNLSVSHVNINIDCNGEVLDEIVGFIYKGRIDISSYLNLSELYSTSKLFGLESLTEKCFNAIKSSAISLENWSELFKFSISENDPEIKNEVFNFISSIEAHDQESFIKSNNFRSLDINEIKEILEFKPVLFKTTSIYDKAVICWIYHNVTARKKYESELKSCQFNQLESKEKENTNVSSPTKAKAKAKSKFKSSSPSKSAAESDGTNNSVQSGYYIPQIGDVIVYFREGHDLYNKKVKSTRSYPITQTDYYLNRLPYNMYPKLQTEVLTKILKIEYELAPTKQKKRVRLNVLELAELNWKDRKVTGIKFIIKYHEIKDLTQFLEPMTLYENSLKINWKQGDFFRYIDPEEYWHIGEIIRVAPFTRRFPNSKFLCYKTRIYKVKEGKIFDIQMSPWELSSIPSHYDLSLGIKSAPVKITPEEDEEMFGKQINPEDWPKGQKEECQRISLLLDDVFRLDFSEQFRTPVNIQLEPEYPLKVTYPIDLTTIKSRLENLYYRRKESLVMDIDYIAKNAEAFNKPDVLDIEKARALRTYFLTLIQDDGVKDHKSVFEKIQEKHLSSPKKELNFPEPDPDAKRRKLS